jgi:RNA-directed DNA polymerase
MKAKPFTISKNLVFESYLKVKAKRGSGGTDGISMAEFDKDMKNRLYKIWNQMSSGSYMPPAVKLVEVPKANGGIRPLGIPTISDRIAQGVVKAQIEGELEKIYHDDSYGFRNNKSEHDAIATARVRCWRLDWVIDLDIKEFFHSIPHDLLMIAVEKHCSERWMLLYIERWLKAPLQKEDGEIVERTKGVPQGSVIGPILSNLYLHYTLDMWLKKHYPECNFERYADDAIVHCSSERAVTEVLAKLGERMKACGLTLHSEKTKIVYCKDSNRTGAYPNVTFDFLGYTFMPRMAQNGTRKEWFTSFLPAVSRKSMSKMNSQLKRLKVFRISEITLNELSKKINPILCGWISYYGRFTKQDCKTL